MVYVYKSNNEPIPEALNRLHCSPIILLSSENILALTTSGLKMSYATYMEYPAVSTEDISVEVEGRKLNSSSHQTAKAVIKSHKKSQSAGYFKRPGFLSTKEHIELEPIPNRSDTSSDVPRLVASESVLPSDKIDGVELLSTSFSEHKL